MSWAMLIPNSLAYLGSLCLGLAFLLVWIDMPGGVSWKNIGGVCAVIGGFGTIGGAGGWIGHQLNSARAGALSFGARWGTESIGVAAIAVIVLGALAWAYSRIRGKGIDTKGSGMTGKVKSLIVVSLFAIVGGLLALIPGLYGLADTVIAAGGNGLRSLIA